MNARIGIFAGLGRLFSRANFVSVINLIPPVMKTCSTHFTAATRRLMLAAFILAGSQLAHGGGVTTRTWDGEANDGNWSSSNNWSANTAPTAANIGAFATGFGSGGTSINLGADRSILSLSITTATDFSLNNNILTLANGDISRTATTGTTTINSGVLLGGAAVWDIAGSSTNGTLIVNGIIDDGASTFALDKTGNGKLILNNANTFGGTLTLSAGTLVLGNNSAAGAGTLDLSAGTIEGAGGTRTISNNLTIANNITFGGGELIFSDSFDQGGDRAYTVNNTTTFSGSISGSDTLTKDGTGTLILSGDNTPGNTIDDVVVNNGALRVANNGALGSALGTAATGTDVNSGGALELIGGRTIGNEAMTLDGTGVSSGGALRNISGNNSWAGAITINSATRINSDADLLTLDVASGNAITGSNDNLAFGGAGNTTVADAIGIGTGTMTKDGNGVVTFAAGNSYDGTTTISGGTLFANNASGSATGTGAVSVGASGKLGGSGFIAPTGANGINVSGVLAPGGSLNVIGTLTLNLGGTTGTVAMSGSSGLEFLLGVAGLSITSVGASDLLSITGASANDFAFNNNTVDFLNSGAVGFYKLFDTSSDNANTWTGLTFDSITGVVSSGLTANNLAGLLTGTFIVGTASNGGTTGDIYFQVVPEPSGILLGGPAALLLLARRRRKG